MPPKIFSLDSGKFLGSIAFLYKIVFEKYLVKKYNYTVAKVEKLNSKIIEISLSPNGEEISSDDCSIKEKID